MSRPMAFTASGLMTWKWIRPRALLPSKSIRSCWHGVTANRAVLSRLVPRSNLAHPGGAMSLADEVVGGILIAAGLAGAIRPATNMLAAGANPDKNQPRVRVQQRLYLAAFLLLIADGILMATELSGKTRLDGRCSSCRRWS